jgi:cobalamin biosynthesis protein CobT
MVATGAGGYGDLSNLLTRELDTLAAAQPQTTTNVLPEFPLIGRHRTKGGRLDEVGALSASSRMRARLLGLLQSVKHQPDAYGCSGRKLACQRLVRLSLGDPKVFRRRVESKAMNTAVMILLDLSGSMASRSANEVIRAAVASLAAFALHHCLSGLAGVKVSSAEFSSRDNAQTEINILADFGEKPQSSAFNIPPDGGTPTHSALWYARAALLQRPEPRRIILILTDGSPCSSDRTMDATRRCLRDGIEIVAIGVLTDAVQRFWENNQVITSVADLPKAMFEAMEELLVGRERKCLR